MDRLREILRKEPGTLDPPYRSILEYLGTVRNPEFRTLEPQVAALLIGQTEAVGLLALKVLALSTKTGASQDGLLPRAHPVHESAPDADWVSVTRAADGGLTHSPQERSRWTI